MNPEIVETNVNLQMVESIFQLIRSLPKTERTILEQRLAEEDLDEFSTEELMELSTKGGAFDFWHDEPELYTFEDGEPIEW